MKKMSPIIHNSPAFKEVRKAFQGINATTKGSIEKSKRRNYLKTKVMHSKYDKASQRDLGYTIKHRDEYDERQD